MIDLNTQKTNVQDDEPVGQIILAILPIAILFWIVATVVL